MKENFHAVLYRNLLLRMFEALIYQPCTTVIMMDESTEVCHSDMWVCFINQIHCMSFLLLGFSQSKQCKISFDNGVLYHGVVVLALMWLRQNVCMSVEYHLIFSSKLWRQVTTWHALFPWIKWQFLWVWTLLEKFRTIYYKYTTEHIINV